MSSAVSPLPILTLPDPEVAGEGRLDPLGLATLADHLADRVLPGMTARMSRPRFLTAIAVCAAVCDGLETPEEAEVAAAEPYLVFEWYLVEAFARHRDSSLMVGTPGTDKASRAVKAGAPMSARGYLKTPTVFGYHGIYKRLARHLGIVDADLQLSEEGVRLLRIWEEEQGLSGFCSTENGGPAGARGLLRSAIVDGLRASCTARSSTWQGWALLAKHLAPGAAGSRERRHLLDLVRAGGDETMSCEVFRLMSEDSVLKRAFAEDEPGMWRTLAPRASRDLHSRFAAIEAYEALCRGLEEVFDWLRHLSSRAGARPVQRSDFAAHPRVAAIAKAVPLLLENVDRALEAAPLPLQREFGVLAEAFEGAGAADMLFDTLRRRHELVQGNKPPEGKRPWFEFAKDDAAFIRPGYRLEEPPREYAGWGRPYRLVAARSFCGDLARSAE